MALGLQLFPQRTGDGAGEPLLDLDSGEEFMHVQSGVSIVLSDQPPESPGTLYISTQRVIWLSDVDRSKGYAVDFLSLSLHAVSRDPEGYPTPCIYTQIFPNNDTFNFRKIETGDDEDESDDSDVECDETFDISKVKEMRLVPSDPSQLDIIFEVFCECAELNPELSDEEQEEGGGGVHNWVFSADQMQDESGEDPLTSAIGYSNGNHELVSNVLELQIDDERFEDAEEMEGKNGRQ